MSEDKKQKIVEDWEFEFSFDDIANLHKKKLNSVKANVVNGDVVKQGGDN